MKRRISWWLLLWLAFAILRKQNCQKSARTGDWVVGSSETYIKNWYWFVSIISFLVETLSFLFF
jgi:uncharacterized membrane protein